MNASDTIVKQCVLCLEPFVGYGNNPAPVADHGLACDDCNNNTVIPERIERMAQGVEL